MAGPTDSADGRYMNYFQIGYNSLEFILEFGQMMPDEATVLHARFVTSPVCAKLFSTMLVNSIGQYETAFGAIPDAECPELEGE